MATALEAHCWGLVILAHCLLTSYLGKFFIFNTYAYILHV